VCEARSNAREDTGRLVAALHTFAQAARDAGQHFQVLEATEEALLHDDRRDPSRVLDLRLLRAQALSEVSLDVEALQEAQAAFDDARQSHCYVPTVRALSTLGVLYARVDDFDQAYELLMQALSRARDLNERALVRSTLNNLLGVLTMSVARLIWQGKEPPQAMRSPLRTHATALWSALGEESDTYRRLTMGVTAAYGLVCAGDLDTGLLRLELHASLAAEQGFEAMLMKARGAMACAHMLRGEQQRARDLLLECLAAAERLGNGAAQRCACEALVATCTTPGDTERAARHVEAVRLLTERRERGQAEARGKVALHRAALRKALVSIDRDWM
jgi:tetratricopeptide (TPR) repeat protein